MSKPPIDHVLDERQMVTFDYFLSTFEITDEDLLKRIHLYFKPVTPYGFVEYRAQDTLVRMLAEECISLARSRRFCERSPIVTKDKWVFWIEYGGHQRVGRGLSLLYSGGKTQDPDYMIHEGLSWQISTEDPTTIMINRDKFPVTRADLEMFKLFDINDWSGRVSE